MATNPERTVDKIGGSSMAWPQTAMEIVRTKQAADRIVVVSAPGADTVGDRSSRMTELLKHYERQPNTELLDRIQNRLADVAYRGGLNQAAITTLLDPIERDIETARERLEPIDPLGETWMARAFAQMLGRNWRYLPAVDLLQLDESGGLDDDATQAAMQQLQPGMNYVVDGNQGRSPTGHMVRIGDGGSDVSAAYVRRALGPGVIRIHSDVDGYKTVDPNLKKDGDLLRMAKDVPFVTYREAEQLGKAGNGLVHRSVPRALRGTGSQTYLYATRTGESGTRLLDQRLNVTGQPIVGVTGERSVFKVTWSQIGSEDKVGATVPFRQALKDHGIPLHSTTTDDDSESIYTSEQYRDKLESVLSTLSDVSVRNGMSSVTLVGEGLLAANDPYSRAVVLSRALGALAHYKIPLDSMTSDGISATFFVPQRYYTDAVDVVHHGVVE